MMNVIFLRLLKKELLLEDGPAIEIRALIMKRGWVWIEDHFEKILLVSIMEVIVCMLSFFNCKIQIYTAIIVKVKTQFRN